MRFFSHLICPDYALAMIVVGGKGFFFGSMWKLDVLPNGLDGVLMMKWKTAHQKQFRSITNAHGNSEMNRLCCLDQTVQHTDVTLFFSSVSN